ncbi:unnamed protein product, partial [marine sediment metagenome]
MCRAMMWRLEPLFDSEVSHILCRDTDHSPTIREREMAGRFVDSGKALHCIQDNPAHSVPMLGGMISFNVKETLKHIKANSVDELLSSADWDRSKLMEHGCDQHFMNRHLWPLLKNSSCLHSIKGNKIGASLLFPLIESKSVLDKCIPFMGTARCDFETWYKELRRLGYAENIKKIEQAEKETYIGQVFSHLNMDNACVNKRRVVLATDESANYYFFMPIVSILWQKYMGYCPIVMVVGTTKEWLDDPQKKLALEEARKIGAEIHFIPKMDGYRT